MRMTSFMPVSVLTKVALLQSYERAGAVASESIAAVRTIVSFGAEEKVRTKINNGHPCSALGSLSDKQESLGKFRSDSTHSSISSVFGMMHLQTRLVTYCLKVGASF